MEAPDPARGIEASKQVVREGQLHPRYKAAAKSYTRIVVLSPLIIWLSYELYQRRFMGKEQKILERKAMEQKMMDEMSERHDAKGNT